MATAGCLQSTGTRSRRSRRAPAPCPCRRCGRGGRCVRVCGVSARACRRVCSVCVCVQGGAIAIPIQPAVASVGGTAQPANAPPSLPLRLHSAPLMLPLMLPVPSSPPSTLTRTEAAGRLLQGVPAHTVLCGDGVHAGRVLGAPPDAAGQLLPELVMRARRACGGRIRARTETNGAGG